MRGGGRGTQLCWGIFIYIILYKYIFELEEVFYYSLCLTTLLVFALFFKNIQSKVKSMSGNVNELELLQVFNGLETQQTETW